MNNKIEALYKNLCDEHDILLKIFELEENKNSLLVKGKLDDFTQLNEELEKLIKKSNELEKQRINSTVNVLSDLKLNTNSTLRELIPNLDDENKKRFDEIYLKFKTVLSGIKILSSSNSEMLKNTVKILDISLSHLTEDEDLDYGKNENEKRNNSKSMLFDQLA